MSQSTVGTMPNYIAGQIKANEKQVGGLHYKTMGVEPWDVIDTWPIEQRIGAYRAGALKYVMRMGSKDQSQQEIGKGIHYLEKLLEVLRENETSYQEEKDHAIKKQS
jgi:hypothetical protein